MAMTGVSYAGDEVVNTAKKADVHRIPTNGGPTQKGLEQLAEELHSSRCRCALSASKAPILSFALEYWPLRSRRKAAGKSLSCFAVG